MAILTKPVVLMAKARMSMNGQVSAGIDAGLIRCALHAALNTVGATTALGPNRRQLQKEFDFVISGSSVDLTTAINDPEPLLLPFDPASGNYIPFEAVTTSQGRAIMISDKGHLDIQQLD